MSRNGLPALRPGDSRVMLCPVSSPAAGIQFPDAVIQRPDPALAGP